MLLSENWPDLLTPVFFKIFTADFMRWSKEESNLADIYRVETTTRNFEKISFASALGDFEEFGGTVNYGDTYQGYDRRYEFTEYTKGIKVERKLADDDMYGVMNDQPSELAHSAYRTREKHGAETFNEAFTSENTATEGGYLDASGNPTELCASDHANAGDSGTQNNEGTSTFAPAAVETTRRNMRAFRGDVSEIAGANMDTLIIPDALEEQAYEIINSKGKVDVATNNVNFHYGRYKMIVWPNFLTDSNNWFGVDYRLMKKLLFWWERIALEFAQDKNSNTYVAQYTGYMRYNKGPADWRFIYGHKVA